MNLEGITLRLLTLELQKALLGGKVFKIFAPSKEALLLLINKNNTTVNFLADLGGGSPLLYLPEKLPERPDFPSTFCMLLRKHLEEGRLTAIEQDSLERVITFSLDLIGPSRQIVTKHLIFELTGKNSNIIFTDENNIILDAARHIGKGQSSVRQILPGKEYMPPPPQEGKNFLTTSSLELLSAINTGPESWSSKLIATTRGIGKNLAEEILTRCHLPLDTTSLTPEEFFTCGQVLDQLQRECTTPQGFYATINQRNVMKQVLPYKPQNIGKESCLAFPSLLDALSYSATLVPVQIPDKELLTKIVASALTKTKKKLKYLADDLATAENADSHKIIGDTLMAHLYEIPKGAAKISLENIYDGATLTITLSPSQSAIDNAQGYYKKYNKYKRALGEIKKQQEETTALLDYLASLETSLTTATTKGEISEIKEELMELGLLAKPKKKALGTEKSKPLQIKLTEDTTLYIGKNNKQNDYVTFKLGRGQDLWFHVKNMPGSHVLLKTTLPTPLEEHILLAASFAAGFSKGKSSSKVAVDYTQKRFVKKPNGSKPGFVIYTDQQTVYVTPKTSL